MTEFQPMPVHTYTPQSETNIDAVNKNKVIEEYILRLLDSMMTLDTIDKRWCSIARTHIEIGFGAMNRAIFQPQRLTGPLPPFGEE